MLKLRSLHYSPATADRPVLRSVSLEARVGHPVLIAGASGSGKTSLMDVVSGLSAEQSGKVLWNDRVLTRRQRRWLCGLVFQFPERHFLGLTVGQELRLGHRRLSTEQQQSVLTQVGLSDISLQLPPNASAEGSSGVWPWPFSCCEERKFCCWTSPPRDWTGPCDPTCSISWPLCRSSEW